MDRGDLAAVAMVGSNIADVPGITEEVIKVLDSHKIACTVPEKMNGSADNFTVLVFADKRKETIKLLHNAFVGKKIRRLDTMGANNFWKQQAAFKGATKTFLRSQSQGQGKKTEEKFVPEGDDPSRKRDVFAGSPM